MAKQNFLKKNEASFSKLLLGIFAFIFLALIIPAIGVTASSPAVWVSVVDFFTAIRTHVSGYWMFYTLGGAIMFTYLRNSK